MEFERVYFTGCSEPIDEEVNEYFEEKCGGVYKWIRVDELEPLIDLIRLNLYSKLQVKLDRIIDRSVLFNPIVDISDYRNEIRKKIEHLEDAL